MLYGELTPGVAVESEEVAPNIVLDFDETNRVIGIEIEDASQMIDFQNLEMASLPFVNLIMKQRESASTETGSTIGSATAVQ